MPIALEVGLVGLAAGMIGAALGVGGGVILVPGFVLLAGLSPRAAVGASLVCVVGTAVAATISHLRRGTIRPGDGLDLPLWSMMGAVSGGLAAARVPGGLVLSAFAALLLVTAGHMWPWGPSRAPREHPPRPAALRAAVAGGGLVAGLFGVGGGIVFVPVLHLWGGRRFHHATALSLLMIVATASAGASVYLARGDVTLATVAPALVGTLLGAAIGVPLAARARAQWLKAGFALLLAYVAIEILREAWG